MKKPKIGFQRIVNEDRCKEIAREVLDQRRAFPNAIVLASDLPSLTLSTSGDLEIPSKTVFLVIDGQHRLYAQQFSSFDASYACMVHCKLTEVQMAKLFLEINDNQKRVPASLRWDLVRLVRPEDDPSAIAAADLIFSLATEKSSPLFQRIDLTGEKSFLDIKQASLAPELRLLVSAHASPLTGMSFEGRFEMLCRYFAAIKFIDPDGWNDGNGIVFRARVLRALLKLLPAIASDLSRSSGKLCAALTAEDFQSRLKRIRPASLERDKIQAMHGNAGIKAIHDILRSQILPRS